MKNRIVFFYFLILANAFPAIAQVNLQTGAAQHSIPLFSYSDGANRLSSGISLVYTAGNGIKASDVATSVGIGWGIEFGGAITRIQHGEPDDQKQDGSFPYPYPNGTDPSAFLNYANNYYPDGYMYSSYDPATSVDNGGGYIPLLPSNYYGPYKQLPVYLADREQDQYMFSFNGQQGYFVIGKDGGIKTLVDSKLKIEFSTTDMTVNNIITRISEFRITDPGGIQYVFKDLELSQLMQYKRQNGLNINNLEILYPGASATETHNIFRGEAKNLFTVNKWFLSEIKNPLTGKKITFNYSPYDIDMLGNKSCYRSVVDSRRDINIQLERIKGKVKRLTSVKYSDKEEVVFNYSSISRNDLPFDKALESIDIKYNNVTKYSWQFSFGYFVKNQIKAYNAVLTQSEKYRSRLCLLGVERKTPDQLSPVPPYTFSYYIGSYSYVYNGNTYSADLELAPAFTFYQDHWGYPNKWFTLTDYMDELREDINYDNVDWSLVENYVINGLSIRDVYGYGYFTGMLKTIKNPTGGEQTFEYENNSATVTGGTQQIPMGGARVSKITMYDGVSHSNDIIQEYKYIREDGLSSGWGYEAPVYETSKSQRVYNCGSGVKPGQILATAASSLPGLLTSTVPQALADFASRNAINLGSTKPQALISMAANIIIYIIFSFTAPSYADYSTTEWSYYSTVSGNTLPFQYKRVEMVNKLGAGTTGKTTYKFTSDQDFAIDVTSLAVPNSSKPRYAYWAYGLPLSTLVEDKDGNDVSKTEYTYDLIKNTLNNSNNVSQKWRASKLTYNCSYTPGTGLPSTDIDHDIYYPIYGRIELKKKKDYFYNDLQESTSATTDYVYSSTHYQLKNSSSLNSKGELIESNIYYADDYTLTGVPQTMRTTANMGAVPLSSQTIITKAGAQKYLLSGTVTEFGITPNGDIKPVKTYSSRSEEPVLASTAPFSASQLIPGTDVYEKIAEISYSADGLPAQTENDQGKTSIIYDYNNKLPVATAVNAKVTDIAYTSFEADGYGGWSFDPLKISEEFSPTGKRSLKATSGGSGAVIFRPIYNTKKYILSFWKKGENPILSGASYYLRRSYENTATGYTYYEYEVSDGTDITITNRTGTSPPYTYYTFNLDEIRIYPIEARMSTTTYDPVWGKIAETDQNGRIIYYEYDSGGRLKVIRDQDRNVIKTYEYNYKQ
ncbi:MAG: hypothetical protein E6Q24_18105 [Chitinophagaceae bacterium]|nr:MAG: hypothetical protein E6Q24_18105 [Chitinophagaceae bacterium]